MAAKASWASLAVCFGTACLFGVFLMFDQVSPYDHTGPGVLKGFLPRATLVVVWVGATLTTFIGMARLLLIRKADIATNAVYGIVGRSVCGIITGLLGVLIMWLIAGHVVIGFQEMTTAKQSVAHGTAGRAVW